jgi:hypothetical protein
LSEAISDRQLVSVLRPFVRAAAPVLDAVRESDPLGLRARAREQVASKGFLRLLSSLRVPGTSAWDAMTPDRRVRWWVDRFGRLTNVITAIPGLGGALADRLPVQDLLGVAAQGLVLCAIAGEYGTTDTAVRVRLLASVLFGRDVDPDLADGRATGYDRVAENAEVDRLSVEVDRSERARGALSPKAVAATLWRLARSLRGISEELGKRPRGRWYHHLIGMLPVVGALGDYFGERAGLRRARRRALAWLRQQRAAP